MSANATTPPKEAKACSYGRLRSRATTGGWTLGTPTTTSPFRPCFSSRPPFFAHSNRSHPSPSQSLSSFFSNRLPFIYVHILHTLTPHQPERPPRLSSTRHAHGALISPDTLLRLRARAGLKAASSLSLVVAFVPDAIPRPMHHLSAPASRFLNRSVACHLGPKDTRHRNDIDILRSRYHLSSACPCIHSGCMFQ